MSELNYEEVVQKRGALVGVCSELLTEKLLIEAIRNGMGPADNENIGGWIASQVLSMAEHVKFSVPMPQNAYESYRSSLSQDQPEDSQDIEETRCEDASHHQENELCRTPCHPLHLELLLSVVRLPE